MKLTTFFLLGLCFGLVSPYAFSGVNNKLSDDISYCLKIKNSDVVVLKKRALGAVYLSKKNNARSIRVKRLK